MTLAVVTGAGSGIGRATALRLAADGARVIALDRDRSGAEETAAEGSAIEVAVVDVSDADAIEHLAGRLDVPDVIVNCAGWDETRSFLETGPDFWRRVIDVNLLGVVAVSHAFVRRMVDQRHAGRVVNVASDAGRVGSSGETVYAGAKGGVIAFSKSLAREVARHGITVNVVCPGPTDTPLLRAQPESLREALVRAVPMRRLGAAEDVAHAIAFFASDGAGYVTGQVLSVSGGLTMVG